MTRKSFYIGLIVVMAAYAILISNAKAECVKVDANLGPAVSCSVKTGYAGFRNICREFNPPPWNNPDDTVNL